MATIIEYGLLSALIAATAVAVSANLGEEAGKPATQVIAEAESQSIVPHLGLSAIAEPTVGSSYEGYVRTFRDLGMPKTDPGLL